MFQLVFKGECSPGTDPATARNNAKNLFKATVEQVDRMFSGQPVVIRNKLEELQAEKYRAVLKKHGMVAYVQPMEDAAPPQPSRPTPDAESRAKAQPAQAARRPEASQAASGKAGASVAVEPGDRLPVAGDNVDTILSGSGLTLDPVGVTLEQHREAPAPMFQHLEDWTLAPPGTELGVKRDLPPPVVPDVSHLSLADQDHSDDR